MLIYAISSPPKKANATDDGPQKPWTRCLIHQRRIRDVLGPLSTARATNCEQTSRGGEGWFFVSNVLYIV